MCLFCVIFNLFSYSVHFYRNHLMYQSKHIYILNVENFDNWIKHFICQLNKNKSRIIYCWCTVIHMVIICKPHVSGEYGQFEIILFLILSELENDHLLILYVAICFVFTWTIRAFNYFIIFFTTFDTYQQFKRFYCAVTYWNNYTMKFN